MCVVIKPYRDEELFYFGISQRRSVLPVSSFPLNHCSGERNLYVAKNKYIICAFEISGRWSYESVYTALLPCLSCLENSVFQEPPASCEAHRLDHYSFAFYEVEALMGSSAYSPLVRENQQWGGRFCLAILVEVDEKQVFGLFWSLNVK